MFSRYHAKKKKNAYGVEGRLQESGLLSQELGPSWKREADRPAYNQGTSNTADDGVSSFPEKNNSISSGTIRLPAQKHQRQSGSVSSIQSRDSVGRSNSVMSSERARTRRERTFVGAECAVCEEPLEHTLRGERILQFSCTHVSHEACFYEYIKEIESQYCPRCDAPLHLDTSRAGNVLDIEKISNLVRSVTSSDTRSIATPTPTHPWDDQPSQVGRPQSRGSNARSTAAMSHTTGMSHPDVRERGSHMAREAQMSRDSQMTRNTRDTRDTERYAPRHNRSDSEATGATSSNGYPETTQSGPRRAHDYDVQAMETSLASPRSMPSRNPIPLPTVTVRSEFPTISRSRQQQTLTCLITVEVPDSKWRPDPEDLQMAGLPPLPPTTAPLSGGMPHHNGRMDDQYSSPPSPKTAPPPPRFYPYESREVLEEMTESLRNRVENWHGLDFSRFGKLRLYGTLRVGKDKVSWQELECFLFAEMLICVKEKKLPPNQQWDENGAPRRTTRCTLKGSILIKKHLNEVAETGNIDENVLTLSLSVAELPQFHLRFENRNQLKLWQQALLDLNAVEGSPVRSPECDLSETDEEDWQRRPRTERVSSLASSWGGPKSVTTAPTEYTTQGRSPMFPSIHVPIDVVVVVPISSSMQGVKINLVRDALKFMVQQLGDRDRMGLVTFGSGVGGVPIVGMTTKAWGGWGGVLASIKPVGQKSHRADVIEGANVAMDLLMQRKYNNPVATIMLISDASTADGDSVDFVISRAEAAKISIHSFGLGMTHKPDTMIELSSRTKASYTYVKDWMMLRECLAGCLGAAQTLSHQNVKLKLRLPEGSPAKFHKISGALQITKRAAGRDAEASLGDLRFGDKRDILVQLVILPDTGSEEQLPQDPWETIVSGLEALGGPMDSEDQRTLSIEEVPLIQADLSWGDILRDGTVTHMPRPSLLAITMLPAASNPRTRSWINAPPIPPHPQIVQRRMELLTSDMLTRALTLVSRGQHDRAHTLLNETRSILKGLGKGGLPPVPPVPNKSQPSTPHAGAEGSPTMGPTFPERKNGTPSPTHSTISHSTLREGREGSISGAAGYQGPHHHSTMSRSRSIDALSAAAGMGPSSATPPMMVGGPNGIDATAVAALDAELESSLEWIGHPAVFGRDSRKAVLQAIGVISSQRAFTFRTPIEALWAGRVNGVRRLTERSREWREDGGGEGGIMEES
ncbi:von Willebrand RING finger domain-containing protein [Gaeumannomyces tritici R3-111a-1]|uniref:von Willebrand RING finger domain-containing protein n=1 Tax=Gaeumannomyces tritici (strain R3-111a-1) TaxID=644352 RepID=J3NL79_GAET3|nr:von Willebrand RING finger domain-containing protein [Gaeumannomyces tritici R3-111a-1]EJT82047.1 von Willebrand RING finger domain-containing protein [Gaeumannomyces tritici R3-111a-1]